MGSSIVTSRPHRACRLVVAWLPCAQLAGSIAFLEGHLSGPGAGRSWLGALVLGLAVVMSACAPASVAPAADPERRPAASSPARPTLLTMAVPSEPTGMSDKIYQAASNMDNLFQANLMFLD